MLSLFYKGKREWNFLIPGFLVLVITFLAKPTGIVLFVALAISVINRYFSTFRSPTIKWTLSFAALVTFLILANKMLSTFQIIENYQKGEIIYAVTTLPNLPSLDLLVVESEDLDIPSKKYPKMVQIALFMVHNPLFWSELFFKKISIWFFTFVRFGSLITIFSVWSSFYLHTSSSFLL